MQAWLQQRCILIFVQYLRPPRTDSFMRFENVPLLYYEWKKILLCSNTPSSYRTYVLFIYADGGKYLFILLWKQMLRLCDRGPFCSCDFLTENWSCDKLSGRIFSEKPPIYIFFSVPSPKQSCTDLVCLASIQLSFWFFYGIYMNSALVSFIHTA